MSLVKLTDGRGGGGGGGEAKSHDGEEARSSINHLVFNNLNCNTILYLNVLNLTTSVDKKNIGIVYLPIK